MMGFDDDLRVSVTSPNAVPLLGGRRSRRYHFERHARQKAGRLGAALRLEQCADIGAVGGARENLVSGYQVCASPARGLGRRTRGRLLAAGGDEVEARLFRDDARERDVVELAFGGAAMNRNHETGNAYRRQEEGAQERLQREHGDDVALRPAIGQGR